MPDLLETICFFIETNLAYSLTAFSVLVLLLIIFFGSGDANDEPVNRPAQVIAAVPRRRAPHRRFRPQVQDLNEPPSEDEAEVQEIELPDGKIGAKKRAKLEAKAEKKAAREVEEKSRLERQKKLELEELERAKQKEKEEAEEKAKEEEEKRAKEEKERKEQEEYLKMKEAFQVEEEGYEEGDQEDSQNLLQEFVNHIKDNKVIIIEDLAARFKLKTQACLDRIKDLQNDDILTGVIDDRGKFIYVSKSEMDAVAKFIRQRGRVSIAELAESSNQLINLIPVTQ
ncbi:DDRGK domain-containing protein 1 [Dendroctonus ponderosae]|uniref:DDRGK domain-containing protein 1 n=1 Tax=Dendroctonus ponderosae TaxID=77166 RepID=U4UGM3_DENPD|nr:DDRGK domain-containing protein 1 [Dendroctonus ponderosae]ERL93129.1 hypothetical protein D910_10430 [Dendroctonus ponderosae]KAH1027733.1 hypothetical protein HUJ05_001187 [Dendroctonus ponderosae]